MYVSIDNHGTFAYQLHLECRMAMSYICHCVSWVHLVDVVCLGNTKVKVECHLAFPYSSAFIRLVLKYSIWLLTL